MKVNVFKQTAILLILAGSFSYCSKRTEETDLFCATISEGADLCTDALCTKYMKIWKELLIQRNKLPEDYFCRHIELAKSSIDDWNDGTSFSICYSIKIDWAITYTCDQFIININNNLIPTLDVPRNVYLDKKDIDKAINMQAFSSEINKLTSSEKLKFKSLEDAINFAIKQANVKILDLTARGVFIDRTTGHISLEAVESHLENNKCTFVTLDLINGQINIDEGVCYVD